MNHSIISKLPNDIIRRIIKEGYAKGIAEYWSRKVPEKHKASMKKLTINIREGFHLRMTAKCHRGKLTTSCGKRHSDEVCWQQAMKADRQETVYFLAGIPLRYWSFGGTHPRTCYGQGRVVEELQQTPDTQGLNALRELGRGDTAGFEWMTEDHAKNFKLLKGLPTFLECKNKMGLQRGGAHGNELHNHWNYIRFLRGKEQDMIDGKS